MIRFLFSVIFLFHALCFAEKQFELPEETQKQLATLVAANEFVAVVEINKGTFTGACMVHDKVKVVAQLKGKLYTTALFSSINADKKALPPTIDPPSNPLPILKPGTYVVVVESHEIIHSFPGIKVPFLGRVGKPPRSFNYFILHNNKNHCAWAVDSMEANYLRELLRKNPNFDK